jgi:hypothetical protein
MSNTHPSLRQASLAPTSFSQEWFLLNSELGRVAPAVGIFAAALRMHGVANRSAAERALNALITRHAALRTIYVPSERYSPHDRLIQLHCFSRTRLFVPGLYTQRVIESVSLHVTERTLETVVDVEPAINDELARPFGFGTAPQMRAVLFRIEDGDDVLALIMSHLAMDGWSVSLFIREFISLYEAELNAMALTLRPIEAQYDAFAIWQHRSFRVGRFACEEAYWLRQWTANADDMLRHRDLPFALTESRSIEPSQLCERLDSSESALVKAMTQRLRTTPYSFFRTAMTIALHYYTGKGRIAFWGNFANRRHAIFVSTVGWCSNSHMVAVEIQPNGTLADTCRLVSTAVIEAHAHEALPLPALWQRLGQVLDSSDLRINFDLLPRQGTADERAHVEPLVLLGNRHADLDIRLREGVDRFTLVATYNRYRYETAGVRAMLLNIRRIATTMARNPATKVSQCGQLMEA